MTRKKLTRIANANKAPFFSPFFRQEEDHERGKAIQRYFQNAFNAPSTEASADTNPLQRKGRHRLTATNPLLD